MAVLKTRKCLSIRECARSNFVGLDDKKHSALKVMAERSIRQVAYSAQKTDEYRMIGEQVCQC